MFQIVYVVLLILFGFNLCACFDQSWESYQSNFGYVVHEELVVTNLTCEENAQLPLNVNKWTNIAVGPNSYSVGLMKFGIAFLSATLNSNGSFIINSNNLDLKAEPVDVVLLEHRKNGKSTIMLIVAIKNVPKLLWYSLNGSDLIHFWTWPLQKNVLHLNLFKIKNKQKLLVANELHQNQATADLFEFNFNSNQPNYWFLQTIFLSSPTQSSAISNYQYDYYLSIPQSSINKVSIYKYGDSHFVPYKNITSQQINNVISFEIGFKSFIAFDGLNAGIYQFSRSGLIRETINNSNLDGINYWLSIPVETYRDDVILLAQRFLEHGSHKSPHIDIITYNGYTFEEHVDISCFSFGEEMIGLSCLVGENFTGIFGTSFLSIDDKLALMVPGKNCLFTVQSAMVSLPNPMDEQLKSFSQTRKRLQNMMDSNSRILEDIKIQNSILLSDEIDSILSTSRTDGISQDKGQSPIPLKQDLEELILLQEELRSIGEQISNMREKMEFINLIENESNFDTIIINGIVEIEGETHFETVNVEEIKEEPAKIFLNDIVMKNDIRKIDSVKTFTDIMVENLIFENINGISAESLLFKNTKPIVIAGDLTFKGIVNAQNIHIESGKINDILLENEIVNVRKRYNDSLSFENIVVEDKLYVKKINNLGLHFKPLNFSKSNKGLDELETVFIPQNLTVTNINGENFNNFLNKLCLRNIKCHIPGNVIINGDVKIESDIYVEYLNDLKFPEEFILQDSSPNKNITGKKTFTGSLTAEEIRARGLIDGIKTIDIITLSTEQYIPGTITFEDLNLTEELNVTGKILGKYVNEFLPNPTLIDVEQIMSNVNFKNLDVEGDIVISNKFNENHFESMLSDLVYKDDEISVITAMKTFPEGFTVRNDFNINSNSINDIDISSFVTKDTDQILNMQSLNGIVNFDNIFVDLFGNINVTKLDQECVKLTGEQFISSTLIFSDSIEVENLEIEEKLNDLVFDDYLYSGGDREINHLMEFNNTVVENMFVHGNFEGEIEGFDLRTFSERMLSYTKEQTIDANYNVNNTHINHINAIHINNINTTELFNQQLILDNIQKTLFKQQTKVNNIYVNGSVQVQSINNINFEDISQKSFFKSESTQQKEFVFVDDVYFENIEIEYLSGVKFTEFISNLIFKNETDVEIYSEKEFVNGLTVKKLIEINKLNNILKENILTKQSFQEIVGPIIINGDVHFDSDIIVEEINDFPLKVVFDNFDMSDGSYRIKGDVMFRRMAHVTDLMVNGYSNNKPTQEFLDHMVYINGNFTLNEDIIFENIVDVQGNIAVTNHINNIDLSSFVARIVLTTKDTNIQGLVTFSQPVNIQIYLEVETELVTNYLFEKNTSTWLSKAVFVNKGLLTGNYSFEEIDVNYSLRTDFLNDIDMTSLIPLKLNQTIDYLSFGEVTAINNVKIGNLVNGYNLLQEVDNTMLNHLDQEIKSDVVFTNNVLVRNNVNTNKINDIDVNKIVTINTDQNLTAIYNFNSKVTIDLDLNVSGTINAINFTKWVTEGVKLNSLNVQNITDIWSVKGNVTFEDTVSGNGLISNLNLSEVMSQVDKKREYKYSIEKGLIDDYTNICNDLDYLYNKAKSQIFKFKHFKEMQHLDFSSSVENVYFFKDGNNQYLLVNIEENCFAHLLIFNETQFHPIKKIKIGYTSQIITVKDGDFTYLVTRSNASYNLCSIEGTNLWKFEKNDVEWLYNIESQDLLQESLIPGTFYSMDKQSVTEFRVISDVETNLIKYRKWDVHGENMTFVPRGLGTGLALNNGVKLIRLIRTEANGNIFNNDLATEIILKGNITEEYNSIIPGQNGGDIAVVDVGVNGSKRSLLAVATHEETSVKGRLDFIKIYENIVTGKMFHKVPTYEPSSILSINFENGETLLVFMENHRTLQIYEYKGIEGFKYRSSAQLKGSKLFLMTLPIKNYLNDRKVIGLINVNRVSLFEAIMAGNKIRDDLHCGL